MIKLITAIGPNNLIGKGDKMPWHISNEFKHFKETTMGHTLFMGGTTFNGIPGKLPGRKHVVLSLNEEPNADLRLGSIEEAKAYLEANKDSGEVIFIAGGKFVYETFYQYADELIISHVKTDKTGDVHINWDLSKYEKNLSLEDPNFTVYRYFIPK